MDELRFLRYQLETEARDRERVQAAWREACAAGLRSREDRAQRQFVRCVAGYLAFTLQRLSTRMQAQRERLRELEAAGDLEASAPVLEQARHGREVLAQALGVEPGEDAEVIALKTNVYAEFLSRSLEPAAKALALLAERHYALADWRRTPGFDADSILEARRRTAAVLEHPFLHSPRPAPS